ncbi:MAG: hypothetical protein JJLCMIEE_01443 [Acidimicrobiales bacterium]|nr:hypothetical protein [Acidimicrobiales bacterium]
MSDFAVVTTAGGLNVPFAVRARVHERRLALAPLIEGSVLDLGGVGLDLSPYRDASRVTVVTRLRGESAELGNQAERLGMELHVKGQVPDAGCYDRIVSAMRLAAARDQEELIARLQRILAPEGRLYAIEPTCPTGRMGRVQRRWSGWIRRNTGWSLGEDVVANLRRSGLFVAEVDRFRIATAVLPLRTFVQATVLHPLEETT